MKIIDRIGDHALQRAAEFRAADPKLHDPVRGTLTRLAEWLFIGKYLESKPSPHAAPPISAPVNPEADL